MKTRTFLLTLFAGAGFAGASFAQDAATALSLKDTAGQHLDVLSGGKILARYMYAHDTSTPAKKDETYKPYLHVFDAEGKAPITKGPGGEFTHHRGLFIGWMKIGVGGKTYDRWHMKGGDQISEAIENQTAANGSASFTSKVKYTGEKDEAILAEERTLSFLPAPKPAYAAIEMTSKLTAVAGETTLGGDPEHSGLQFRPANEVDRTATVYLYPKADANPHKDVDYPWVGESYTLDGKRYSVIYLNHPSNPKNAPFSAYRDYGRFGAWFRPTIPDKGSVTLKVRILVSEGELPPVDFIQQQWNTFAGKSEPVPVTTLKPAEHGGPKPAAAKKAAAKPEAKPAPAAK